MKLLIVAPMEHERYRRILVTVSAAERVGAAEPGEERVKKVVVTAGQFREIAEALGVKE